MSADIIGVGPLEIDTARLTVTVDGQRTYLASQEYQILELLARRAGGVVTTRDMMDHIYGGVDEPEMAMIDIFVSHMRKVLAAASSGRHFVYVVWGQGYTIAAPSDAGS